eukprot:12426258-Karenia_brevis.AAC.1
MIDAVGGVPNSYKSLIVGDLESLLVHEPALAVLGAPSTNLAVWLQYVASFTSGKAWCSYINRICSAIRDDAMEKLKVEVWRQHLAHDMSKINATLPFCEAIVQQPRHFECTECGLVVKTKVALWRHMRVAHN